MPEPNRTWSFARIHLIARGIHNRATFRLRDSMELVTVRELAPSDAALERSATNEWLGIRVVGASGERWVCASDLLPASEDAPS